MRIIFVRHGKPDYATDTLVELGKLQALATAERLADEGISEIYASTMGRAVETAEPTAQRLGLSIHKCDFMREISWGSEDGSELPFGGHPWLLIPEMVKNGESIIKSDWASGERFVKNTKLIKSVKRVCDHGDEWLRSLGYEREGDYYRVTGENTNKTVAMFSHHGASAALISHMLNIPFPGFCIKFSAYFASVSEISLDGNVGELISPAIKLLCDSRHVPKDADKARAEQ